MSPTEYLTGLVHPRFLNAFFCSLDRKPLWTKWEVRSKFLETQEVVLSQMFEEVITRRDDYEKGKVDKSSDGGS